jgi:hypothetical protein
MTTISSNRPSLREPLALIPIGFSLGALAVVTIALAKYGVVHEADEGTAAHLFQLCMGASCITSVAFAIQWLARAPWRALRILGIQLVAALVAVAPVFYFKL